MACLLTVGSNCRPRIALTNLSFLLVAICSVALVTSCGEISEVQIPFAGTAPTGTVDTIAASIAASPSTSGVAPFLVTLVGNATSSSKSPISSWMWNFGDGIWCTNEIPTVNRSAETLCSLTVLHSFNSVGTHNVSLSVTDKAGTTSSGFIAIIVSSATATDPDDAYCGIGNVPLGATTDGPADMPIKCMNTSLANTPSPGAVITLGAGGNLQAAYNALQCGQTLSLAHGVTWKGPVQFAPKNCDDQHWIWITSDGAIPPPGTRVDPTYVPQLATISMKSGASANKAIGDHIRFIGIEWSKRPGAPLVNVVEVPGAFKVVFDRNYAHGNP
jgi:PKD repeat protein